MKLPNGYGSVVKLSGKRRKPYQVRKTVGWHYDEAKDKQVQDMITIGYAATRADGLQMLADYNNNPFDTKAAKMTFSDVYEEWSKRKFPTLKKIKVLFNQLFDYALKNDICNKDYSSFVDIVQYKDRNPNKYDRNKFEKNEIDIIWEQKEDKYYQIVLMLLYSGVRISEMLDLKKENVHLNEQYFDVICSKTENGIRKVPIADKVLPYYKAWYESCPECEYLLHTEAGKHFEYRNYYDSYFKPLMEQLGINRTPHCCRHTCISMLAEAGINQTIIKKIAGHSGAMTLTEKVYTHFDIKELVDAINKI